MKKSWIVALAFLAAFVACVALGYAWGKALDDSDPGPVTADRCIDEWEGFVGTDAHQRWVNLDGYGHWAELPDPLNTEVCAEAVGAYLDDQLGLTG